jgi:CHAT domain-containing protein
MARIRVTGEPDPALAAIEPDLGALGEMGGRVEADRVQAARVMTARAGVAPVELDGLRDDTVVELTVDGSFRFWVRYDQLAEDLSAARTRGTPALPETIDLPPFLAGPATRGGIGETLIEAVRSFDIDIAGLLGGVAGKAAGPILAKRFDLWMMETQGLGHWVKTSDNAFAEFPVTAEAELAGEEPILLFLHGTVSNAAGSFGILKRPASRPEDTWRDDAWLKLTRAYGERILAYEHHTLSLGPIDNAIALLKALPDGACLHVVSHSRGGMVGELLCRQQRTDGKPPFAGELEALERWIEGKDERYAEELAKLTELGRLLEQRRPRVERFVRVACPAAGTTLAGGRIDRWLSLATDVLDFTGLSASQTYRCIKGFLLAVVKMRTEPEAVPGLEAMMPGSLLTAVLNRPGVEITGDLSVIAGDIEGGSFLNRLAIKVTNWFYGGNHDLVVDTFAMYGGLTRKGGARVLFDQGKEVSHFSYFGNRRTADALVAALRSQGGDVAGFQPLVRPKEIDKAVYGQRDGAPRPGVFILPGLMGSHLAVDGAPVWADLAQIAWGQISQLAIPAADAAKKPEVKPLRLVADAYSALVAHLSATHEVIPFPYDWRLSLESQGELFAQALADRLGGSTTPVRIIGHSSGGLVAVAAFASKQQLWRDFMAREGSRLLLLGTPWRGTWSVARTLLGEERLVAYLDLLDIEHGVDELAALLGTFPGLLELLPSDGPHDLLESATWGRLQPRDGDAITPPKPELLNAARKTRDLLAGFKLDRERVVCVAGVAAATPAGVEVGGDGRMQFLATSQGDGRVPWAAGLPENVGVWYAAAEHGRLAAFEEAFPAYVDLLENGSTRALPRNPPAAARAVTTAFVMPPDKALIFPNEEELTAAALGYVRKPPRAAEPKTKLTLVHGNLAFARWPVLVGHYRGDTIAGSEGELDRRLDRRLSRRRDLRVYPGELATVDLVLDPAASPPGAIIAGLGQVGDLTPGGLRRTLVHALKRYALAVKEAGTAVPDGPGVSILLVGAGEGGISIRDSVAAILEALAQANRLLGDDRIRKIELVELYEDRAIQAVRAIRLELRDRRRGTQVHFDDQVQTGEGGRRRAASEEDPTWWRRRQVKQLADGGLQFIDLTDRARAEVRLVTDQRQLVDRFIRRAVDRPVRAGQTDDPGATLFQLMLPQQLKEEARSERPLVLVLDKDTAGYPWELLHEGDEEVEPPAVRAGLIRQLLEESFEDRPVMATADRALVVGDPPSGMREFPELPGARAEAERVAQLLRGGREVTDLIGRDPESIVAALMDRRGWKVLHLAAHGAVEFATDKGPVTGMVLGEGLFLTPGTIRQLPAVPELVFLNCCHLGRVDRAAEQRAQGRYPELAANLATAFIRLGARAVVAAGWAVDDGAAKVFAETLYERMLAGAAFGTAIHEARRAVYGGYQRTNTWGAYQCYGDPAYRLDPHGLGDGTAGGDGFYAHPSEARIAIENVIRDAQTMVVRDADQLKERLDALWARVPEGWRGSAELLAPFGEACGELGRLDQAIDCYTQAMAAEKALAPVRSVEQLANLRTRRAVLGQARNPVAEIRTAINALEDLMALNRGRKDRQPLLPETAERLALLGSCYKRLAQVSRGDGRKDALIRMADHYKQAHDRALKKELNPYPLLNWLLAEELLAVRNPGLRSPQNLEMWLGKAEEKAQSADDGEPSFWNGVHLADVTIGRVLASGRLVEPYRQDEVIEAYLRPWRRGASPLKFQSVLEQMTFVAEVLTDGPNETKADRAKLVKAIRSIIERLRAATKVS